jgi:calcineurin-like phosphoesterase family protein
VTKIISPSDVWFTSDTHFGHAKMLELRPQFSSTKQMDEYMVERWNTCGIRKSSRVYHLGDVGLCSGKYLTDIIDSLQGQIFLIKGNHDKLSRVKCGKFMWVKDVDYMHIGPQKIFLSHYPHRSWPGSGRGSIMLHGHSHGNLPDNPHHLSIDMCVDLWDFTPVPYELVLERMTLKSWILPDNPHDTNDRIHAAENTAMNRTAIDEFYRQRN